MFRFIVMGLRSLFFMIVQLRVCTHMNKHPEKYNELDKYRQVQKIIYKLIKNSRTETIAFGTENLPKEGPYILFANHQGKYDGLGVVATHMNPLTIIMDKRKADMIVAKQMMPLIGGRGIDLEDPKQQIKTLMGVTKDLKEGKTYLIFPEGGYKDNKNTLQEFKTGVFKCAYDSKCTVVPVTLIDSYKGLSGNSLKKVTTQVHYLKPIPYDEYKDMKRGDFAELVKARIQETLDKYAPENQ